MERARDWIEEVKTQDTEAGGQLGLFSALVYSHQPFPRAHPQRATEKLTCALTPQLHIPGYLYGNAPQPVLPFCAGGLGPCVGPILVPGGQDYGKELPVGHHGTKGHIPHMVSTQATLQQSYARRTSCGYSLGAWDGMGEGCSIHVTCPSHE